MNSLSRKSIGVALAFGSALCLYGASDSDWISKVPVKQQAQTNPMAQDSSSVEAGRRLFAENCASCHGTTAQGIGKHPSLVSQRIHNATDGDLAWLLQNGNLRKGMPSWSRLPEQRRWQIIAYLRSLNGNSVSTETPPKQ
jgi:mono/diheme cytochrome c family protein